MTDRSQHQLAQGLEKRCIYIEILTKSVDFSAIPSRFKPKACWDLYVLAGQLFDLAYGEHGVDSRRSLARRGASDDTPMGRASIRPCERCDDGHALAGLKLKEKNWGSLSLPSRFKPDLGLFRTFGVGLSTSPGCGCGRPSPCVGPVGIEATLTRCKSSG